mmetsp:Transcript_3409/g.10719  ORF Transcript_3409/g.10719 Transcript_3409/m.10719 type:complete len:353 (+) Transcript_3409:869-1927(+)
MQHPGQGDAGRVCPGQKGGDQVVHHGPMGEEVLAFTFSFAQGHARHHDVEQGAGACAVVSGGGGGASWLWRNVLLGAGGHHFEERGRDAAERLAHAVEIGSEWEHLPVAEDVVQQGSVEGEGEDAVDVVDDGVGCADAVEVSIECGNGRYVRRVRGHGVEDGLPLGPAVAVDHARPGTPCGHQPSGHLLHRGKVRLHVRVAKCGRDDPPLDTPIAALGVEEAAQGVQGAYRSASAHLVRPLPHDLEHGVVPADNDVAAATDATLADTILAAKLRHPLFKLYGQIVGTAELVKVAQHGQATWDPGKAWHLPLLRPREPQRATRQRCQAQDVRAVHRIHQHLDGGGERCGRRAG